MCSIVEWLMDDRSRGGNQQVTIFDRRRSRLMAVIRTIPRALTFLGVSAAQLTSQCRLLRDNRAIKTEGSAHGAHRPHERPARPSIPECS